LLAQLDVVERHLVRGLGEAHKLDAGAEHEERAHPVRQRGGLCAARDHVLGRHANVAEHQPARGRAVDIAVRRRAQSGSALGDEAQGAVAATRKASALLANGTNAILALERRGGFVIARPWSCRRPMRVTRRPER